MPFVVMVGRRRIYHIDLWQRRGSGGKIPLVFSFFLPMGSKFGSLVHTGSLFFVSKIPDLPASLSRATATRSEYGGGRGRRYNGRRPRGGGDRKREEY